MKKMVTTGLIAVVACSALFVQTQLSNITRELADLDRATLTASTIATKSTKVIVVGGRANMEVKNDVFAARGVESWSLISPHDAQSTQKWSPRVNANAIYYKGRYWIIGTSYWNSPSNDINSPRDIWNSVDGVEWNYVTGKPPFNNYYAPFTSDYEGYYEYRAVVLNDTMYVIGGKPGNGNKAVVWSSTDGVRWTTVTEAAPFEQRVGFSVVAYNGKMYVIGGRYAMNTYGNTGVWSSADGVRWKQDTATPAFSNNVSFAKALVLNNKMYLLGGISQTTTSGTPSTKVWSSTNGSTWTLVSNSLPDGERTSFEARDAIVVDGKILLGNAGFGSVANKLWTSTDGVTWTLLGKAPLWSPRLGYRFVAE